LEDDGIYSNSAIHYGVAGYDNILQSFVTVFQIASYDDWSSIMFNTQNASAFPSLDFLFYGLLIIFCSFVLLNLLLAVVMESYMESEMLENQKTAEDLA